MPVIEIDNYSIGTGLVGALTQVVMDLFSNYTTNQEEVPLQITRYAITEEESEKNSSASDFLINLSEKSVSLKR